MKTIGTRILEYTFGILVLLPGMLAGSVSQDIAESVVKKAYELRIEGQADAAERLLWDVVIKHPDSSLAWYELARARQHLVLGNPREMEAKMPAVQAAIAKAHKLEPDNYTYASLRAMTAMFAAYPSIMRKAPGIDGKLDQAIHDYEAVLEIRPDCPVTLLTLTEIYAFLHRIRDGDIEKAQACVEQLESVAPAYAVKAREILLPDDADRVQYWKEALVKFPDDPDIQSMYGKACLLSDKIEEAVRYAASIDENTDLSLAFARYHMMQGMLEEEMRTQSFESANAYFDKYLESNPVDSMKAWVFAAKATMARRTGDTERGQQLLDKARSLDPFYSRASGVPPKILFTQPGKAVVAHSYWFRFI